jgi:ribosomal peptide maturation radical SAM protein 1
MNGLTFREVRRRPISSLDQSPNGFPAGKKLVDASRHLLATARRKGPVRELSKQLLLRREADVLIVVPPFASLYIPSLGAHTLQACAREAGLKVEVLYANFLLASLITEDEYNQIGWACVGTFAAERLFARWAFDVPPLGRNSETMYELPRMFGQKQAKVYSASLNLMDAGKMESYSQYGKSQVRKLAAFEEKMGGWLDFLAGAIAEKKYRIVGCSSTFEQTACSVALLNRLRKLQPDAVNVIGGANCEGEMAQGIASLSGSIDYVFSGESDDTFVPFVREVLAGRMPKEKIIEGQPCENMDTRPTPRFHEFFEQRERYLPGSKRNSKTTYLTYETSRGCWWGQKQHCTFCGLNGSGMVSRRKSAERVIEELKTLVAEHPTRNVGVADNIMPHEYFMTLLPKLSSEVPNVSMFYEQKANLSLPQVLALKEAGITIIQPGIESLSSTLLQFMKKGVQAWQNLVLLRYGRIAGIRLWWALLCGFPEDTAQIYQDTLSITRLIHHLPPPTTLWHLIIDRFSPYFASPEKFGLANVAPYPAYHDIFPQGADIPRLAYHFTAEYKSATEENLELIRDLGQDLSGWRTAWQKPYKDRPELKIEPYNGSYVLIDTRGLPGTETMRRIARDEAASLLVHRHFTGSREENEAVERKLAVVVDGWFVPLPVARVDHVFDLLTEQSDARISRKQLEQLGTRKDSADMKRGLLKITCSGPLSALEHPLAPP